MQAAHDEWMGRLTPLTQAESRRVAARDFRGRTIAGRVHLLGDAVTVFGAFARAGARVVLCPCNPLSTDVTAVTALRDMGVEVLGRPAMEAAEDADALAAAAAVEADVLCDMGGELIAAASPARVVGALEATGTGILRLEAGPALPFPVFNWDDIRLKDGLHNRWHVGATTWPSFEQLTSMNLFGRRVAVIGFGPVGRGVAERAAALGAAVTVVERDPVRRLEAMHAGLRTAPLEEALGWAGIVVTVTGRPGILGPEQLRLMRDGAVLFNCGHGNREIDVDWLLSRGPRTVRPHIEAVEVEGRTLYLLNRGNLLNLCPGSAAYGVDLFDPFAAIMILGLEWLLDGGAAGTTPGLHPYPAALEARVAAALAESRG